MAIANWGISTALKLRLQENSTNNTNFFKALWNENQKIRTGGKNVDWFGMLASNYLVSALIISILAPVVFVSDDLDICYLVLKGIAYFIHVPDLMDIPILKVCRLLILLYMHNCIASTFSCFILVILSFEQVGIQILLYLNKLQVSYFQIRLYNEGKISVYFIYTMVGVIHGVFLSSAFFLLLICINLLVLGHNILSLDLYMLAVNIMILLFIFVILILFVNSFIYESTSNTLKTWKGQVHQTVRMQYMKRLVASMRPIALPVGSIGIIDKEIKVNYFNSLVDYAVNTIVACNDFIK